MYRVLRRHCWILSVILYARPRVRTHVVLAISGGSTWSGRNRQPFALTAYARRPGVVVLHDHQVPVGLPGCIARAIAWRTQLDSGLARKAE